MATKTDSQPPIWHTPDALWKLIAPILGPEKPPGTVGPPGHTQPGSVRRDYLCVTQRLSMAGYSARRLRPRINCPRSVPPVGATRRVCPSVANPAAVL